MWTYFFGSCMSHKHLELMVFTMLFFELDPKYTISYVILSNTSAEVPEVGDHLKIWYPYPPVLIIENEINDQRNDKHLLVQILDGN